jgi:hypothetical protein
MLFLLNVIALAAGGVLGASGLIIAKKPDAKQWIDKLVPYQAIIGVALLGLGVVNFLWWITHGLFALLQVSSLSGVAIFVVTIDSILLGLVFGMPQIAKWMPGENAAEQKGLEWSQKLAPFQGILGIIGLIGAALGLLYWLNLL